MKISSITVYGNIRIDIPSYKSLEVGKYLDDVIIDFYLLYLFSEKLPPRDKQRVHVFSSFFVNKLRTGDLKGALRWTKKVNIFDKHFLIIPVNQK